MAERERLTNKERRNQAREERKRQEAEAAKKRKTSTIRNGLITAVIVGVVGAVVLQAFLGGPTAIDEAILINSEEVADARAAAGCEVLVDREPLPDRTHFEANAAPAADAIYGDVRPTHSGPHTVQFHPLVTAGAGSQLDERSTTHNLEHGSVIAWYDPDQVEGGVTDEMGTWSETLNANGFRVDRGGVGIFVSPYTEPGISSGQAIAFRAWGVAMDCDTWDEDVANAFVIDHFGMHGIAPERVFGPFPEDVLEYEDIEVGDNVEAPIDDQLMEGVPSDGGVETDEDATDSAEEGEIDTGGAEQPDEDTAQDTAPDAPDTDADDAADTDADATDE
ncbi:DUF3105 domain-containing protein [Egicoccus halophilus]|uniref:DUF3105 domain-containing protein n=1 Tax=Egicoccus halophilus TaxID=1670830 RepID=A0A8J3AC35_9ACTN|nr:DUF3105 domain-containing protein [Egicoccus halophilus]GGI03902.1 hypothetical protein GCM10011354_06370 [Egicoccus halophilus]